jgi:hypothetical protein
VAASKTELLIEQQNTLTYAGFNASSVNYMNYDSTSIKLARHRTLCLDAQ